MEKLGGLSDKFSQMRPGLIKRKRHITRRLRFGLCWLNKRVGFGYLIWLFNFCMVTLQ